MNQDEYDVLMADMTKRTEHDISWTEDEDHSPALNFRVEIESDAGYPLSAKGYLNRASRKLTFVLLYRSEGCIYRLDFGREHPNLDGIRVGEKHKHRWTEEMGIKDAYVPDDITAGVDRPVEAWTQFCDEANMRHLGKMSSPSADEPLDPLL